MDTQYFIPEITDAFGLSLAEIAVTGQGDLPSTFRVTDLAAESMGLAAAMLQRYFSVSESVIQPTINIDRRLASFWFGMTIRPQGWEKPGVWDAVAGNYQTVDGWIRLHTNAPHHQRIALDILQQSAERDKVAQAVAQWQAEELEAAIVEAGGCAAAMRSLADWQQHAQGSKVSAEPLVHLRTLGQQPVAETEIDLQRPLRGIKVLDLTRVLAGPVAGRFLAGFGADVLRIDPPDWHEPGAIPEVVLGKRCARLDARQPEQLATLKQLYQECDVLLHGYRPGALESLGFGEAVRQALNPAAIDVSLDAYGWTGPWAGRRGFDSLVQMSSGIAHQGMLAAHSDKPVPLPVQALDHGTGYLLASSVLYGLIQRRETGQIIQARCSLARTAELLISRGYDARSVEMAAETTADLDPLIEETTWGPAQRIRFPLQIAGCKASWDYPAQDLGSYPAVW